MNACARRFAFCMLLAAGLWHSEIARGQLLHVSFDEGYTADRAAGRGEPMQDRRATEPDELVPGKFGQAGSGAGIVYSAEENFQSPRGTLAFWIRVPELPGPHDIERLIFVQAKERGYWTYLAAVEWQETVFRAKVFDFYHGHGWHDPAGLPDFKPNQWHHVALSWDQARGVTFYLDGKLAGSTWDRQAWWDRPTPHAIHLSYPGAHYDELYVFDRPLSAAEIAELVRSNRVPAETPPEPWDDAARQRLADSLGTVGQQHLPVVEAAAKPAAMTIIRQSRVRKILDDRIPSWKVMDGRQNLFWPEWRAPYIGDVDFSGSEIVVEFEPDQTLTHLVLRGLVGGCLIHGQRQEYVSREPIATVPEGLCFLAAAPLPSGLTGLRIPRREGMKLHDIGAYAVESASNRTPNGAIVTPLTGLLDADKILGGRRPRELRTRSLPEDRRLLGRTENNARRTHQVEPLGRIQLVSDPVSKPLPLDALQVRLRFQADWHEDVWWLRVQDPVNPQRNMLNVPIRVRNASPGEEAVLTVTLDFWDIMLDADDRLRVELLPTSGATLVTGGDDPSRLALIPGERQKVLAEFAHTQGQLAFSYWQLGSEANGTSGADPDRPGFALLGSIVHNYELKITLEWIRRHVEDDYLANNLWRITFGRRDPVEVDLRPRLAPSGAPEWAVWGRELLERYRTMAHHWADWQGPDGQLGGGWNDDPCFPGVYISLPLMGDTRTQAMFRRVFDGVERTGWTHNSICRGPIDARHATDLIAWRAHMILFDYGEPRHVERALDLTRELHRWTEVDRRGHRRFLSGYFSEDGPEFAPRAIVRSGGTTGHSGAGGDSAGAREFLRDPLFAAWYSKNPGLLKFLRECAEGDYDNLVNRSGPSHPYLLLSYATVFDDPKYIDEPLDGVARARSVVPMWQRLIRRFPNGERHDELFAKSAGPSGFLVRQDPSLLVAQIRSACQSLEEGWQFRGGEARGANDHFSVPGQEALSQMYLGAAMTWIRPAAGVIPPIAVSWDNLEDRVAALVSDASPRRLRVAVYNFDDEPRAVGMRVWELESGRYKLRVGAAADESFAIDGPASSESVDLQRATRLELLLPPQQVRIIELDQLESRPRPEHLPDLAIGEGDIFYDKATDRLKVVVHNIGAAAAEDVEVRFETPDGTLLFQHRIPRLDAPLDLVPKIYTAWMPQPTLHRVDHIRVRIDPDGQLDEITRENNQGIWNR